VDGFPSCRDLRLPVLEMKDECTERQTDDTQRWLEAEGNQKDCAARQSDPVRAGKKNACAKKWRSPSDDPERRHRSEQNAERHGPCSSLPSAREEQTPRQRQKCRGGQAK